MLLVAVWSKGVVGGCGQLEDRVSMTVVKYGIWTVLLHSLGETITVVVVHCGTAVVVSFEQQSFRSLL